MKRLVIASMLLGACSAQPHRNLPDAVIVAATEAGCDRPGVTIDRIERLDRSGHVKIPDSGPVTLAPGRYAISVACRNPLIEADHACLGWGHPNEYPTYRIPVESGVRYTFHCLQVGRDLVYRISESDL